MTLTATTEDRGKLLHILGVSFGIAVAIGGMIGVGILRTPALIAATVPPLLKSATAGRVAAIDLKPDKATRTPA